MNVEELANVLAKVQDNYYHKCKVQEIRVEDDYHFTLVVETPDEDDPIEKKYDTFARAGEKQETEYSIDTSGKMIEKLQTQIQDMEMNACTECRVQWGVEQSATHKVVFEYPVPGGGSMGADPDLDNLAESLGEAHNGGEGGRGSGFGMRDFDFYFTSSHDAVGMVASLEGSGHFENIRLFELDEDGEIVED